MVKRFRRFAIIAILSAAAVAGSRAQNVEVTARVDSNHILIGDWLKLSLEIRHPSDVSVSAPVLPDSLEGFEIVRRDSPVVRVSGSATLTNTGFVITSFDSGMHIFPPVRIRYTRPGDTTGYFAESAPFPVTVSGIPVDTSLDIRDVKPPMSVPITLADILPYAIGLILAGGITWLIRYYLKKRARGESLMPQEPARPPHEIALEALHALESEKLWQRGKVKEYYSQLTDIVRVYIERRFHVMAMEMVSDEVLNSPVIRAVQADAVQKLGNLLLLADLVKFAKYQPGPDENEKSLGSAYSFVGQTQLETVSESPHVLQPAGEVKT